VLDHPLSNLERCRECQADCCRSFPAVNITWSEYNKLSALGANRLYFTLSGRCKLIIENGCEFLLNNRCSIYDNRPDICRRFVCADYLPGDKNPFFLFQYFYHHRQRSLPV
jgi:uncharacterized protein